MAGRRETAGDRLIVEAAALAGLFGDALHRRLEHGSLVEPHRES